MTVLHPDFPCKRVFSNPIEFVTLESTTHLAHNRACAACLREGSPA
jgi:hypothetical protein